MAPEVFPDEPLERFGFFDGVMTPLRRRFTMRSLVKLLDVLGVLLDQERRFLSVARFKVPSERRCRRA